MKRHNIAVLIITANSRRVIHQPHPLRSKTLVGPYVDSIAANSPKEAAEELARLLDFQVKPENIFIVPGEHKVARRGRFAGVTGIIITKARLTGGNEETLSNGMPVDKWLDTVKNGKYRHPATATLTFGGLDYFGYYLAKN